MPDLLSASRAPRALPGRSAQQSEHLMPPLVNIRCVPRTTIDIDASVLRELKNRQRLGNKTLGQLASELLARALAECPARLGDRRARGGAPVLADPHRVPPDRDHPAIFARPLSPDDARSAVERLVSRPHIRVGGELGEFWRTYRRVADDVGPDTMRW